MMEHDEQNYHYNEYRDNLVEYNLKIHGHRNPSVRQ